MRPKIWLSLCALLIGPVLANFDSTMVNIALSSFQQEFHVSLSIISWTFHAYNITFAIAVIPAGRLADQFGRKRIFLWGLFVFVTGTLLCSLLNSPLIPPVAATPLLFFVGRGIQGVGAAALSAAGLAAATAMIAGPLPFIAWGVTSGAAIALGPVLGGFVVQYLSWRWVFFVNLPFVLLSFLLCIFVTESLDAQASRHIDWQGLFPLALFLGSLIAAVLLFDQASSFSGVYWVVALVGLLAFLLIEVNHPSPMLDLRLFLIPSLVRTICLIFLFCFALMAAFVVYAVYLRTAHEISTAALLLFPLPLSAALVSSLWSSKVSGMMVTITIGVVSTAAGLFLFTLFPSFIPAWLLLCCANIFLGMGKRKPFNMAATATVGFILTAAGLFLFTLFPSFAPSWLLLCCANIVLGSGMGLCLISLNALGLADVTPERLGVASGTLNLAQQLGYTVGTAALIILLEIQGGSQSLTSFRLTWSEAAICAAVGALILLLPMARSMYRSVVRMRKEAPVMEVMIQEEVVEQGSVAEPGA